MLNGWLGDEWISFPPSVSAPLNLCATAVLPFILRIQVINLGILVIHLHIFVIHLRTLVINLRMLVINLRIIVINLRKSLIFV